MALNIIFFYYLPFYYLLCSHQTTIISMSITLSSINVIYSHSSLQSREAAMLVSTCEFLSDVVFQDFPAEIFLQRPNIVKVVFYVLKITLYNSLKTSFNAFKDLTERFQRSLNISCRHLFSLFSYFHR